MIGAMKTGRLLKFQRGDAELHAYLFREDDGRFAAVVYVFSGPGEDPQRAVHRQTGTSEADVEAGVRAWVDARYPRRP